MDESLFPVVRADLAAREALRVMADARTSALLVRHPTGAVLLSVEEIMDAVNEETEAHRLSASLTVGRVETERRLAAPPAQVDVSGWVLHRAAPIDLNSPSVRDIFADTFARAGAEFAVVQQGATVGRVISMHETQIAPLSSAYTQCTCAGPMVHIFTPKMLKVAGVCNYLHRARVTCA